MLSWFTLTPLSSTTRTLHTQLLDHPPPLLLPYTLCRSHCPTLTTSRHLVPFTTTAYITVEQVGVEAERESRQKWREWRSGMLFKTKNYN